MLTRRVYIIKINKCNCSRSLSLLLLSLLTICLVRNMKSILTLCLKFKCCDFYVYDFSCRHPEDIDLFTGGVSEIPLPGAKVGPTFACLLARQFRALKRGDRFFYENAGQLSFTPDQLADIRSVTLAAVICRNSPDIGTIQPMVFRHATLTGNGAVDCAALRHIDLKRTGPWARGTLPFFSYKSYVHISKYYSVKKY